MKKLFSLMLVFAFALASAVSAEAKIASTPEQGAAEGIYIAGNPDMYPLEYYDETTECYEGILPELYDEISRSTGIELIYISADSENRQAELALHRQAEIISVHKKGEVQSIGEIELFSYEEAGEEITLCIAFTEVIRPEVAAAIEEAFSGAGKELWLSSAMKLEEKTGTEALLPLMIAFAAVLLLILSISIVSSLKRRKRSKIQQKTKNTDPLTGIGNLRYFEECFAHFINPMTGILYYLAYIGIDIEKIEAYYEPKKIEELQRFGALTITNALGESDFCARIGNGIFAACFMAPDEERAMDKAREIVEKLNSNELCVEQEENTSFRCGVLSLIQKNIQVESAIYDARQGYLFSENEEDKVCFCDDEVLSKAALKSRLQKKLLSAIENEEFNIYFQFILDTKTNRFSGAEVITRWHNPIEGIQMPGAYIEDLKTAGMIERLDFYVLEKICSILEKWSGTKYGGLYLSCNFTRLSLSSDSFLVKFAEILSKYEFDRKKLLIEITEDSLSHDSDISLKNIYGIKELGCRLAIDDMGSGYTSFSDLCEYPVDVIKIDRSIVLKSDTERGNAVLKGITRLGHDLGLVVLCEGVEKDEEDARVREAGCNYIQGFLYSRVLPAENAMEYYEKFMNS